MKLLPLLCLLVMLMAVVCTAQELPSKVLGYKVHNAKVVVTTTQADPKTEADMVIRLTEVTVSHIGLLGAAVNVTAEISSRAASGTLDRLMFRAIKVNGVSVDVDDLTDKLKFEKGTTVKLEKTVPVKLSPVNTVKTGLGELTARRPEWSIEGVVFAFCRIKKFGFTFKRVVPIKLSLAIRNPLL